MTAISSVYVKSMGESPALSDMGADVSVAPDITSMIVHQQKKHFCQKAI